jgi:hypothetical protein
MRTLSQIIEAVKGNAPVDYTELRYALCAMEALSTLDKMDLRSLGAKEGSA